MCPNLPVKVDVFVDFYFHQVLTLTEAAISTFPMSATPPPRSIAALSPRFPSEVSDSFSDSEATIADNNFTSTKRKVICTRGGLRRAAHRGPRTRSGRAHQAVGPQATADIPSWSGIVRTKRRFSFQVFMLNRMILQSL